MRCENLLNLSRAHKNNQHIWNKRVKCVIVPAQILTFILTSFITKFDLKNSINFEHIILLNPQFTHSKT
jgi:uncharacterized membrane protein